MTAPIQASKAWWLYLVRTARGSLYAGITTDIERRFSEHQSGGRLAARALRGKGPLALAYSHPAGTHSEALKKEYRLKRWSKAQKEALICGARTFEEI
ncbi:GIY-YIG nuclease family protein [Ferrimonas gelatinilytica]|uniref:GIY-YIG nuclease family protein n=1 Tax=Ferrimonas gelatinilytica TaxID=1255257 RepID=A0ABP9S239_9GAMM